MKNAFSKRLIEAYEYFGLDYKETPLEQINIEGCRILLKREDKSVLGCAKQRSILPLIKHYIDKGEKKFVVSGSGNSGLVSAFAALHSSEIDEMIVLLDRNISDLKLSKFEEILKPALTKEETDSSSLSFALLRTSLRMTFKNLSLILTMDPRQEAFNLGKQGYVNLRGSTDDEALTGFETISYEIIEQITSTFAHSHINNLSLYIPASSGSTAQGIYEGFKKLGYLPKINIIQTTKTFALVKNLLDTSKMSQTSSHPAESIVDIIGHRRASIEKIVQESGGRAFVITSEQVEAAKARAAQLGLDNISYDSALTLAAYQESREDATDEAPLFVLTG